MAQWLGVLNLVTSVCNYVGHAIQLHSQLPIYTGESQTMNYFSFHT